MTRRPVISQPVSHPAAQPASSVEEAATHLPAEYLTCRDISHSWDSWTATWWPTERVYERVLRCRVCGTERRQHLSPTGHLLRSHYTYPDGYLLHGLGRLTGSDRDRLRLETLRRAFDADQMLLRSEQPTQEGPA